MFDKYTIKPGDTLNSIANKFNTKPQVILEINNIYYPEDLRAGMDIIIPKEKEHRVIEVPIKDDTPMGTPSIIESNFTRTNPQNSVTAPIMIPSSSLFDY